MTGKKIRSVIAVILSMSLLLPACSCSRTTEKEEELVIPEPGCAIEFPDDRDVYHYDLDLTLDMENHTIGGHVDIEFFNDSDSTWNELCLRDYPSLFADSYSHGLNTQGEITTITDITDSRTGELDLTRDPDDVSVLWIDLQRPLKAGKKMTLSYDFTATIPMCADRFGYMSDKFNVTNFYPILAEFTDGEWSHRGFIDEGECFYSEISTYDVTLRTPADCVVASTGEEVSVTEEDGGLTYEIRAPFVRDFVFVAGIGFEKETREIDGIRVNVYWDGEDTGALDDLTYSADLAFDVTECSFNAFNDAFGTYPYEELDIILTGLGAGSGMEYPNLVMIDTMLCGQYIEYAFEVCLCHEIGHQWFMGLVGSDSAGEPWLDESFASYTELVYYEYLGADDETEVYSRESYDMCDPDLESGPRYVDRSYDEFREDHADYVLYVYNIGKTALYQMEECVGREEFHSVIRAYVRRYAFHNASSEDFFYVLYEVAGKDNEDLNNLIANCFSSSYL